MWYLISYLSKDPSPLFYWRQFIFGCNCFYRAQKGKRRRKRQRWLSKRIIWPAKKIAADSTNLTIIYENDSVCAIRENFFQILSGNIMRSTLGNGLESSALLNVSACWCPCELINGVSYDNCMHHTWLPCINYRPQLQYCSLIIYLCIYY